jgi:hypothetical protein
MEYGRLSCGGPAGRDLLLSLPFRRGRPAGSPLQGLNQRMRDATDNADPFALGFNDALFLFDVEPVHA